MTDHAIHWGEGLFLRPHHFQAAERNLRDEIFLAENWNVSYAYGLTKIEIDTDALADWRVVLRSCHIRLRDGTHIRYPEGADLAPLTLPKETFDRQDRVMVFVGLPRLRPGHKNSDHTGGDPNCRYVIESQEVEDENQPGNPQSLDFRWPNVRLLLGEDELSGYDALPILRLMRGDVAEAPPEIDREYIPPILACDAWSVLQNEIIDSICAQIGSRVESQTKQMFDRKVAFESGHREDLEIIFQLHSLNTALGYLSNLSYVRGIHPLPAYMELCRVVGTLAIFRPERRMPELPRYDHDDLATCFYAVKRWIEGQELAPEPIKRLFVGAGLQMQVRMEPEWLEPTWAFYIGVESSLSYRDAVSLLRGDLNMKVGSTRQVDTIFARAQSGVTLEPDPEAPRCLPGRSWTYFKVDRRTNAWKDVEETLNLGIRINDTQVDGRIDGNHDVRLKLEGGRLIKMTFALFAVPTQLIR